MYLTIGILDALRTRDRTGQGTRLDFNLLETALSWIAPALAGIPCAPVASLDEIVAHPHVEARGILSRHDDAHAGEVLQVRSPIGQELGAMRPAPRLSQHTREVLAEIGFNAAEIDGFFNDGVALEEVQ